MASSSRKGKLFIIALILVIAGVAAYFITHRNTPGTLSPEGVATQQAETSVQETVMKFGENLKNVSLLAPEAQVKQSMEENYGPYVTSELLLTWENDPAHAPGRTTSSPWPDGIDIESVDARSDGTYIVKGSVREVTSAEAWTDNVASVYPITLTLKKQNDSWLISAYSRGDSEVPPKTPAASSTGAAATTFSGTFICLPHKDKSGPQTLECALGMKTDAGDNYALDMSKLPGELQFQTGDRVTVKGTVTNDASKAQTYDIKGTIAVTSATKG